ncbi:MAG: MOSC domain-containing protein [Armatimonadota bacterium]|nr:MOSC domain-containing protein [Armatimonadota bacterium]
MIEFASPAGRVLSVNVGGVRLVVWRDREAPTGIWKTPVAGRVATRGTNLDGDEQADRKAHGGPDKAVYAYAREDAVWWETELGRAIEAGAFGENLTLQGVAVTDAVIGERWEIGSALFEVAQPRIPCWKLGARMGDDLFPRRFADAGRPGAYLRIAREGAVAAGDPVRVVHRPAHGVTIRTVNLIYLRDPSRAQVLLSVPELPARWHAWAREILGI